MSPSKISFTFAAIFLFAPALFTGCESTEGGSTHVTSNTYYGAGYYDPWYYGDYDDDDVDIVPPPTGGGPDNGLRPTHPIATPPPVARPTPRPRPSIPSTPRPAPRPSGRR